MRMKLTGPMEAISGVSMKFIARIHQLETPIWMIFGLTSANT